MAATQYPDSHSRSSGTSWAPWLCWYLLASLLAPGAQGIMGSIGGLRLPSQGLQGYEVNRTFFGALLDHFEIAGPGGESLGSARRVLLGREMWLYSPGGEVQAVARKRILSDDLEFFDEEGRQIAKLLGLGWGWFSGPAICEWLSREGKLLGLMRRIDMTWASAAAVVVEDIDGNVVAVLYQSRVGAAVRTHVKLHEENYGSSTDHRLVDFRILALFASLRFGTGMLFLPGQIPIFGFFAASCLFCCTAAAYGHCCGGTRPMKVVDGAPFSPLKEKSIALMSKHETASARTLTEGRSLSRADNTEATNTLPLVSQEGSQGGSMMERAAAWMTSRSRNMQEEEVKLDHQPAKDPRQDDHADNSWEDECDSQNGMDDVDPLGNIFACTCATKQVWRKLPTSLVGALPAADVVVSPRWFEPVGINDPWGTRAVHAENSEGLHISRPSPRNSRPSPRNNAWAGVTSRFTAQTMPSPRTAE